MSLINDALKRAQENQPAAPSAPGPELRPVEQDDAPANAPSLVVPIMLALAVLLTLVGVWGFSYMKKPGAQIQARALAPAAEPQQVVSSPPQQTPETKPVVAAAPQPPAAQAAPGTPAQSPVVAAVETAPLPTGSVSNSAGQAVVASAPKPLKLQSIVFSRRPSAMISGQIVAPGDKIRGYKVAEIRVDRVLLWSEQGTISLTLD